MIKVIIADDEPFIRNCLVNGIDWRGNGFEVVKVCKNGREVVESLEGCQPDVVITDIKMPYMDGMELLTYIRDYYSEAHTLVISGYEEFEYVKHAIDCNADGYLLKPVDPDELLEKMRKVRDAVERKRQEQQRRNDPKYILQRAVNGEDIYADIDGSADRIPEMDAQFYAVACAQLPGKGAFARAAEVLSALESGEEGIFFFRRIWRNHVLVVAAERLDTCRAHAEAVVRRAVALLEQHGLGDCRIAVSNAYEGLDAIPHAMEEASRTMMLRSVINSEKAFFSWKRYRAEYHPFREDITAIVQAIRRHNKAQVAMLLDAIFSLFERERHSFHDAQMFAENLLYTLNEDEAFSALAERDELYAERLMKVYLAEEVQTLYRALNEILDRAIDGSAGRDDTVEALIDEAKRYIEENIGDPGLSLNRIARHLHHNPSYFCYVFSNTCDMTLSRYIAGRRIELARQALRNSDRRVLEICEQIGYLNPNYFGKVFKRETGMTPREYRQKYRG